jgi:hypothetical protein
MFLRDEGFAEGVRTHVDGLGYAVRTKKWSYSS